MPLEAATYISDLVTTNPANADGLNQADDHMRMIKATLQATFPGTTSPLTRSVASGTGVLVGVGSAASPSIAFSGQPAIGFYASDFTVGKEAFAFTGIMRGNGAVPTGAVMDFAMPSAPTGWLECNGAAVSRTTYSVLFATIGTTWGAGDGSTTFNLPPDRYRRGRNAAAAAVGTLQADQNKSHTHLVSGNTAGLNNAIDHLHAINGTTGVDSPDHTHGYTYPHTLKTF
jgi:hypothetical protein